MQVRLTNILANMNPINGLKKEGKAIPVTGHGGP
jgi:hypothetical protein